LIKLIKKPIRFFVI